MRLQIFRHLGVSFVPGRDLVHLWTEPDAVATVVTRWDRRLVPAQLGSPLTPGAEPGHLYAPAYVFLGPTHLRDALLRPDTDAGEEEAAEILLPAMLDRRGIERSYGLYREIAHARGYVATPALLGRYASCFLGVGRHTRLISLNVGQDASSVITFAGTNKGYGRELLKSHGFPVAPGGHAATPDSAVRRAEEIGWPVVLKGLQGGNSDSVILGIDDAQTCRDAAALLMGPEGTPILVERMLEGIELRAHFAAGRLHSVYRAIPRFVAGDGKTSVLALMNEAMPDYLRTMLSHPLHQRRLCFQFWQFGVRKIEDLRRLVVAEGAQIRVSAATASGMERLPNEALHAEDRARLEALLGRYGRPSAGIDLMLPGPGIRLADGGAIIEINCPCGFAYVSDAREVAEIEVAALLERAPGFVENGGRVPVWVMTAEDFAVPERKRAVLEAASREGRSVGVHAVDAERGWLPVLTDAVDHLVVALDEACVSALGMPEHLRPQLIDFHAGGLARSHPRLCATVAHAGGTTIAPPQAP